MEAFFEEWVSDQEHLLNELLSAPRDHPDHPTLRDLITRVLSHYRAYYNEKSRLAARDVLLVFSPTWLTPYEHTFLWIAGWKPFMAFRLLRGLRTAVLTPEQRRRVTALELETAAEERRLSEEMAKVQAALAMPQMLEMVRQRRWRDGEVSEEAVDAVVGSLECLVGCADSLRAGTVNKLVEILNPVQTVDLLTVAAQLHLRVRGWGTRLAGGGGSFNG